MEIPNFSILKDGQLSEKYIKNHYSEFYDLLNIQFSFAKSFSEKLYCYIHGINKRPVCATCGGEVQYITPVIGYRKYCSRKCTSIDTREKAKQTCLERYGDENYCNIEKIKQTCLERYGVENPLQSEEIRNKGKHTCLERYGVENYINKEKAKQTCLERYGVEYPSQSDNIKEKKKKTCLEHYGVDYYFKTDEFKEKHKNTCLERYGVENPFQSEDVREKAIQTNLEHYGVSNPSQSDNIKEKKKKTCLERYGVDSYFKSDEYKQYINEHKEEIQEKIYQTKKQNNTFNSSRIEEEFADWLKEQHIEFKRQYKSDLYPFRCDFYIPQYDLYIEIQGSWVHGGRPYCGTEDDQLKLEYWKSCNTEYYDIAINTWTVRDVLKRETAEKNHLNYLELFSCDLEEIIKNFNSKTLLLFT